jgi:hypothetical protein
MYIFQAEVPYIQSLYIFHSFLGPKLNFTYIPSQQISMDLNKKGFCYGTITVTKI